MTDITEPQGALPDRLFGWWDMFVRPEDDPRGDGGFVGERDTLVGYLRDQRLTLEMKCAGLDAEAMARRSVPPSNLSLLGLVRHLAGVEHHWFRRVMAGQQAPRLYRTADDPNGEFDGAVPDPEHVAEAWRTWRSETAFAERLVSEAPNLDVTGTSGDADEPITLREVLVHMIEEYARHNGHADFLRERIDGRVGQ
ncbi:DinB family protein [Streptomyces sp. NPDC006012]|uniref:DinB family protein n=1 Tax=Streptomyces sp. NPDC006012 TaxID=3364739 RepID=UPI00369F0138